MASDGHFLPVSSSEREQKLYSLFLFSGKSPIMGLHFSPPSGSPPKLASWGFIIGTWGHTYTGRSVQPFPHRSLFTRNTTWDQDASGELLRQPKRQALGEKWVSVSTRYTSRTTSVQADALHKGVCWSLSPVCEFLSRWPARKQWAAKPSGTWAPPNGYLCHGKCWEGKKVKRSLSDTMCQNTPPVPWQQSRNLNTETNPIKQNLLGTVTKTKRKELTSCNLGSSAMIPWDMSGPVTYFCQIFSLKAGEVKILKKKTTKTWEYDWSKFQIPGTFIMLKTTCSDILIGVSKDRGRPCFGRGNLIITSTCYWV
jgi:hypothetical protein